MMRKDNNMWKILWLVGLVMSISGCSTYRSSFACGDAKGASCMSMERVGQMIKSGEIEQYTDEVLRCDGRRCKKNDNTEGPLLPKVPGGYKAHYVHGVK